MSLPGKETKSTPAISAPNPPTPNPPRNEAITTKELSLHNGQDPTKPIWVAVKGTVFDVSRNKDAYGTHPAYTDPLIISQSHGGMPIGLNFLDQEC